MRILLIAYDNNSFISVFPLGIAYVASMCRKAGHEVTIYNQDVHHWPESHLQDYIARESFDVVGVGACGGYYQYRKILKISEAINMIVNRPFYMIGGHIVSPEPEYFLKKTNADLIIIGEGELTVLEVLNTLEHKKPLSIVAGIAYLENGRLVKTQPRPLIENIDEIPFPAWDLFPMEHYILVRECSHVKNSDRCAPVLSGRGCTFKCNFCYRMDTGFRPRSPESIIEEIEFLHMDYGITFISFMDELLMSSVARTTDLCNKFIHSGVSKKIKWFCNGRLNYAQQDVLNLMKKAGCVFINYGIESLDEQALRNMNKALTVKQIISGIENTLAAGISPGFNIIFGNIRETMDSLTKGVDFLLKYDDHSQLRTIRPVTPYPGSPLYYYAIEKGLLNGIEDFYENKHVNSDLLTVNFTDMSDDEFHKALYDANMKLIDNYYYHQMLETKDVAIKLYFEHDTTFRGFRQT